MNCDNADIYSMSAVEEEFADHTGGSEGTKHILSNAGCQAQDAKAVEIVDMEVDGNPETYPTVQPVVNNEWQEDAMEVEHPAQPEILSTDVTPLLIQNCEISDPPADSASIKCDQAQAACDPSPNNILALEKKDPIEYNNVDMEDGLTERLSHPVNTVQQDSFNRGDITLDSKVEDTASSAVSTNSIPADEEVAEKSSNNPAQVTEESNTQECLTPLQTTKEVALISHTIGGETEDSSSVTADKSTTEQATAEAADQISTQFATSANTKHNSGGLEPTALIPESSGQTVVDINPTTIPGCTEDKIPAESSGPEDTNPNTVPGCTEGKNPAEPVTKEASAVPASDSHNSVTPKSDADSIGDLANLVDNQNSAIADNTADTPDCSTDKLGEEHSEEEKQNPSAEKAKESDSMGDCISANNSADEEVSLYEHQLFDCSKI